MAPNAENRFSKSRDIFLSHRSVDKDFVRQLAGDIEATTYKDRNLLTWVDEAEIRPGQSIPEMINRGLETSRFIGLVMTPAYFQSESGWTDAERHAALYDDPDNRSGRLIPLLVKDCPYIPSLIRHLSMIDFRGNRYPRALEELLRVLREEPLPRFTAFRGQLITPGGRSSRETLVTERSILDAYPDVVSEHLYCNLLPVEHLPQNIYTAPIARGLRRKRGDGTEALPRKSEIKQAIRTAQTEACIQHLFMPAFRMLDDRIVTFHDLEVPGGPLAPVIEADGIEIYPVLEWISDEDDRRILVSLLNMAVSRHVYRVGLIEDQAKPGRFYFPPNEGGSKSIEWIPVKKKSIREVAGPRLSEDGKARFWRHQAAYLRLIFLSNKFYLLIKPTWVFTEDGSKVIMGREVGRLAIKWSGAERNMSVLYHVRFWYYILRAGQRTPISMRAGDQWLEFSARPAFVQQAFGVAHDQKDLMKYLDEEIPQIEETEDELLDMALEVGLEEEDIEEGLAKEKEDFQGEENDEHGPG